MAQRVRRGTQHQSQKLRENPIHWAVIISACLVALALGTRSDDARAVREYSLPSPGELPAELIQTVNQGLALPDPSAPLPLTQEVAPTEPALKAYRVRRDDSLYQILRRAKAAPSELPELMASTPESALLTDLKPGQVIEMRIEQGRIEELRFEPDALRRLHVVRTDSGLEGRYQEKTTETRIRYASGIITDSLYTDAQRAGLSENMTMQLAEVFAWDIDFALDIRKGDRFALIYEETYIDGEKHKDGSVLAAEFENDGRRHRAIRYTRPDGVTDFYDTEGRSVRKTFLRTPVDFRRISSKFQRQRFHPVLGKRRPHKGVDYAAKTGTPIRATGQGKVIYRGSKGGYGNTIILRHGQTRTTLYGHMSRFARGVRWGSKVRQGQIIGYVGSSGLATGPHLHYEFRVNGAHRNPLTVKFPNAKPLPQQHFEAFNAHATPLLSQLELLRQTQLAQRDTNEPNG